MPKLAITLAVGVFVILASPAGAACILSHCKGETSTPSRAYITNESRQRLGDLYNPGNGRRVQIRDNHRRIIGYIEADGTVTNTSRQRVGTIEGQ